MTRNEEERDRDALEEEDEEEEEEEKEDKESEEGKSSSPNPFSGALKPIIRKFKKKRRAILNFFKMAQSILILGFLLFVWLTFDFFKNTAIPWFQGQEEVEVIHTEMVQVGFDVCYKVVIDTGEEFCVKERDFPFFKAGEIHYLAEVDGFNRLEVRKDDVRDFLR